jgi:hypothetical protein
MYLLSDELNNLANLKNPLSEDEVMLYREKVDELNRTNLSINKINKSLETIFDKFDKIFKNLIIGVYIFVLGFFIINYFENNPFDLMKIAGLVIFSFFTTFYLIFAIMMLVIILKSINFNGVNISQIFQYSEVRSAQEARSLLYEKINILNKTIAEVETKIFKYYTNQLEIFFNNYLYKKRSANIHFQIALSTFSKLLDSLEELNKSLITPYLKIQLKDYKNYILGREINSGSYSSVSKSNSKDLLENNSDDEKRTNNATVYIDSKTPDISPVTSVLNDIKPPKPLPPEHKYKKSGRINDWDLINKSRQATGLEGEQIVVIVEKYYLSSIGRQDLADKVRNIAREDGDGFGYDVLSFFENGTQKYIEVKSTKQNIYNPFYMSENELSFLKQNNTEAFIYRVLVDKEAPRLKVYSSSDVFNSHDITPSQYKVKLKSF